MTEQKTFVLTENHVQLLRAMWVGWCGDEYGAPEIDPKRPYGNSDVPEDIREGLSMPNLTDEECRALHEETQTALQVVLRTGSFEPGTYVAEKYSGEKWRPANEGTDNNG